MLSVLLQILYGNESAAVNIYSKFVFPHDDQTLFSRRDSLFLLGMNARHSLFIPSCYYYKTDVTVDCFIVNLHGSKDQSLRQNVYKCWEQQVFTVLLQTTALTVSASPWGRHNSQGQILKTQIINNHNLFPNPLKNLTILFFILNTFSVRSGLSGRVAFTTSLKT